MEEVSIVWEYPDSLEEPYKGYVEDFVRNYSHQGIRPLSHEFEVICRLLKGRKTLESEEKLYDNEQALNHAFRKFGRWLNRGEEGTSLKLAPDSQFNPEEILPKFDSYQISGGNHPLPKMVELSGTYLEGKYRIGMIVYKNDAEGPGMEFVLDIWDGKFYALEGYDEKIIGIGSDMVHKDTTRPNLYFLPGTNGQLYAPEKKEIIV